MSLLGSIVRVEPDAKGIARLVFHLKVRNRFDAKLSILSAHAEVRASARPAGYDLVNSSCFVGSEAIELIGNGQIVKGAEDSWRLPVVLSPYHLRMLEEIRGTRDMSFVVKASFVAAISDEGDRSRYGPFLLSDVEHENASSSWCTYKVARSDWVQILSQLHYGDSYMIEVPLRGVPSKNGLKKAVGHLDAAWNHFQEGRDEDTLVSCYKAFEFLAKRVGCENPDPNAFDKLLNGVDNHQKREKLKILMSGLCRLFHLGRHEQGKQEVAIDRIDAEYAYVLSQATLAYLAKRLRRSSPSRLPTSRPAKPTK